MKKKPGANDPNLITFLGTLLRATVSFVSEEFLALGLAAIVTLRPWRDGITYPGDNTYFLWVVAFLFAAWGLRVLLRGESIRFGVLIGMLWVFYAVALITSLGTVQFDATYRALITWAGYLMLFMLASNGLRSRRSVGIVLGAFALTALVNAAYGIIHVDLVLPNVRAKVNKALVDSPEFLIQYFGTATLSPDIRHRLSSNRAFGTFLFANSLAAFLVMAIPYALGESVRSILSLKAAYMARGSSKESMRKAATWPAVLATSACVYFVVMIMGAYIYPKLLYLRSMAVIMETSSVEAVERVQNTVLAEHSLQYGFYRFVFPALIAAVPFVIMRVFGSRFCFRFARLLVVLSLSFVGLWCLWRTASRGGMLALGASLALVGILLFMAKGRRTVLPAGLVKAVAAGLLIFAACLPLWSPGASGAEPPKPASEALAAEGLNVTASDLRNVSTAKLRFNYWKVGWTMARANFLGGVGLGNFGTVYPKYQHVGAGEVQLVHNDYLQMLCETGIFGMLAFLGFWCFFAWFGARAILRMEGREERWVAGGLYASVLAVLAHAVVDFPFANPSVAYFAFILAGLFLARLHPKDSTGEDHEVGQIVALPFFILAVLLFLSMDRLLLYDAFLLFLPIFSFAALLLASLFKPRSDPSDVVPKRNTLSQIVAIPLLVGVALVAGASVRVYAFDYYLSSERLGDVGSPKPMQAQFRAGLKFFRDTVPGKNKRPLGVPVQNVLKFIDTREDLLRMGSLGLSRPDLPKGYRALKDDEPLTLETIVVISDRAKARVVWKEGVERYLKDLERMDGIYPHSTEVASNLYQWYDYLVRQAVNQEEQQRYTLAALKWAEACVARSPEQSWFHEWYGKALWMRANLGESKRSSEYFIKGLDEYKLATKLYPISDRTWQHYGEALRKYGKAQNRIGQTELGAKYIAEGKEAFKKAKKLRELKKPKGKKKSQGNEKKAVKKT